MMNCRDFIDLITSGKLEEASPWQKAHAKMHGFLCKKCSTFSKNDDLLHQLLNERKQLLKNPPPHQSK